MAPLCSTTPFLCAQLTALAVALPPLPNAHSHSPCDMQADDIERPAMALQPDQLPAQPSNTLHHLDDVRRPSTAATSTPTPLTTGLLGGGASGGAAGRQPSGTTPQADRRRW